MNTLQLRIQQHQPELEAAIHEFIAGEFQQTASFHAEPAAALPHKDRSLVDLTWQVIVIIATLDGAINFAQRVQRLERVEKLHAAIQQAGKPVYLRLKNTTVDLYHKSVDDIMNLLAGADDAED